MWTFVINVWSLYYSKYLTQIKDGPSFIKFLKSAYSYNHGHNILRLLDILPSCPLTTSEAKSGCY